MKKNLTLLLVLAASAMQAQYFQHWYNRSVVPANMTMETFNDGIRTKMNYSGGIVTNWYNVGYGETHPMPGGLITTDEARFVRVIKTGATVSVNIGHQFADNGTVLWLNSHGKAICEINNGLGTGGYLAVGNVMSNSLTNGAVPGGSDGLFYKMNNAGTTSARYRFDVNGRADYFTDIYASKFAPGTYYVCGYSSTTFNEEAIVMSIQANGTVNWFKTYQFDPTWPAGSPASAFCRAYGIAEDIATGNLIVVGSFLDGITPNINGNDGLVFYLNSAGTVLCSQTHHVFIDDQYQDVIQKANGNFAITGFVGDGNQIAAAFYHIWLTEMTPACFVVNSNRYDHGIVGAFNQSKGYSIIERQNIALLYEYYIAGPSYNTAGMVSAITKINAVAANPPVAWYGYATQSGVFESGYAVDYSNGAATKPGLLLLSNTNAPAATAPFDDSYMMKAYFNGATCTNNCAANTVFQNAIPLVITTLVDSVELVYKRKALTAQTTTYTTGVICTQNAIGCGSNARNDLQMPVINAIDLYPNPAEDIVTVALNTAEEGNYVFEVTDITGRITQLASEYLIAGEQTMQLDVSNLAKGIYTLKVTSGMQMMSKKLVIQ